MISLFIDTSSSDVSIVVVKDEKILSKIVKNIPNEHSIYTTSFLDKVIKDASIDVSDVDRILVVNGPGSFTGVRIGVTIAKVYAYLEKIDIVCVSSLKMRAITCSHDYCLSVMDARHGNYYLGLYDSNNREVVSEQFASMDMVMDLVDKYNPIIVSDHDIMIDNIEVKKQELDFVKIVGYYKNYESLDCHLVVPNYLKLPQALEK